MREWRRFSPETIFFHISFAFLKIFKTPISAPQLHIKWLTVNWVPSGVLSHFTSRDKGFRNFENKRFTIVFCKPRLFRFIYNYYGKLSKSMLHGSAWRYNHNKASFKEEHRLEHDLIRKAINEFLFVFVSLVINNKLNKIRVLKLFCKIKLLFGGWLF